MSSIDRIPYYLEVLVKSTNQIVFAYEIETNQFSFLNPAFEKIWNLPSESVKNNPGSLWEKIHPEDKEHVQRQYQDLKEGALIPDVETRIQLPKGAERWLCVKALLLEDEQVIIGFAEDITSAKQYNSYLKKFTDKKNAVLNILSHDLAGPLAMIQSLSKMLREDLKSYENQEVHQVLELIEKNSVKGTLMIQEFVQQEFLESANVDVIKRRINLVAACREILEEYQQTQHLTGKHFYFETTSETLYLQLDDNKFMQAINNLISNALKFTPDGGEIKISLEEKETSVLVKVADNGVGIPEQFHATLFNKFTQARRPGLKGEPSVGLGMSIIKTIVEWHQGKIWFESQENQGSVFYIEIPKN
ncbi:PAS domain-containing sensor histidine kinase [Adhaeribacter arboris]|uniref:histidine kinase n=1 Tax=Adhaeribacter arboris TaxID=2072846 RepID=A0A2T2YNH1_9BACT|nr:PAS domain-containing sensor histidine kinase [Adhaeribacter arboris]PSR57057.1 PAS domain-containing sensor histidine kinase [Adhaeribacter arboris]